MAAVTPDGVTTLPQGSTDLTAQIYRLAIISSGNADLPSGQGVICFGIIEVPPVASTAGLPVGIRRIGKSKIVLGETMSAGDPFCAFSSAGAAGVATTADHVMGTLDGGGVAGDVVECTLAYAGIF